MPTGFQQTLDHLRLQASSEAEKGALFERLMQRYFHAPIIYADQFSAVSLWSDLAVLASGFKPGAASPEPGPHPRR